MILEVATFDIKIGTNVNFEAALKKAGLVIAQSKGLLSYEFTKCMEMECRYLLLMRWETLEDHTIGFRESELFKEWRTLIGPFFKTPPFVLHFETKVAKEY